MEQKEAGLVAVRLEFICGWALFTANEQKGVCVMMMICDDDACNVRVLKLGLHRILLSGAQFLKSVDQRVPRKYNIKPAKPHVLAPVREHRPMRRSDSS